MHIKRVDYKIGDTNVTTISLYAPSKQILIGQLENHSRFPNRFVNIKEGKDERWVYLEPFSG